jgi:hypothetical protein
MPSEKDSDGINIENAITV